MCPLQALTLCLATAELITVYHTLASMPSTTASASYFMITRQQASLKQNKPFGDRS